jgi:hypothetical protein
MPSYERTYCEGIKGREDMGRVETYEPDLRKCVKTNLGQKRSGIDLNSARYCTDALSECNLIKKCIKDLRCGTGTLFHSTMMIIIEIMLDLPNTQTL